jgi:lipopolysaccharide export LptBFGC system permease protein LptF
MKLAAIACAVFATYFLVANGGEYLAIQGYLTAVAAVWLPNLLLVLGSVALSISDRRARAVT